MYTGARHGETQPIRVVGAWSRAPAERGAATTEHGVVLRAHRRWPQLRGLGKNWKESSGHRPVEEEGRELLGKREPRRLHQEMPSDHVGLVR
jgi:hypothetical protein